MGLLNVTIESALAWSRVEILWKPVTAHRLLIH
jgi:hypothetical protein